MPPMQSPRSNGVPEPIFIDLTASGDEDSPDSPETPLVRPHPRRPRHEQAHPIKSSPSQSTQPMPSQLPQPQPMRLSRLPPMQPQPMSSQPSQPLQQPVPAPEPQSTPDRAPRARKRKNDALDVQIEQIAAAAAAAAAAEVEAAQLRAHAAQLEAARLDEARLDEALEREQRERHDALLLEEFETEQRERHDALLLEEYETEQLVEQPHAEEEIHPRKRRKSSKHKKAKRKKEIPPEVPQLPRQLLESKPARSLLDAVSSAYTVMTSPFRASPRTSRKPDVKTGLKPGLEPVPFDLPDPASEPPPAAEEAAAEEAAAEADAEDEGVCAAPTIDQQLAQRTLLVLELVYSNIYRLELQGYYDQTLETLEPLVAKLIAQLEIANPELRGALLQIQAFMLETIATLNGEAVPGPALAAYEQGLRLYARADNKLPSLNRCRISVVLPFVYKVAQEYAHANSVELDWTQPLPDVL